MKKIISFISKHYFEIFIGLVFVVVFGVAVLPIVIFLAKLFWNIALNAPLPPF